MKNILMNLKEKNLSLLIIFFQEKLKSSEVTEFILAIQQINELIERILDRKYYKYINNSNLSFKIFERSLEKLQNVQKEYEILLNNLNSNRILEKYLINSAERKNIEQLNSVYLLEATILEEKHNCLHKEFTKTENIHVDNKIKISSNKNNLEVNIDDILGKKMWFEKIGEKVFFNKHNDY